MNLSAMHRATAARLGPRTALRFRRDGLYRDLSWADYRRRADGAAAALIGRGVRPGDRVAILAENGPDWLAADLAVLAAGAADVPVHAPSTPEQVAYQLRHSGARAAVVGDQAQADKVLASLDELPDLTLLVGLRPVDARGAIDCVSWEGLVAEGARHGGFGTGLVAKREAAVGGDNLATIIYTSGTTGDPKGVMLTHANLFSNAEATLKVRAMEEDDRLLSWLPYSHIYARTVDHYLSALAGVTVCLAESPDTLLRDLAETRPTWMTSVPRFYEKVWAKIEALPPAARGAALKGVFGGAMRHLTSGGAPLPRHVAEGFEGAGLPIYEGYGLTESSPVISFNAPGRARVGTVGQAIPGVEVSIAPDGEILTRGPHVMKGYWKDEAATRAAVVDGWLHTGDVGTLDADGFLTITDRKKDLIVTSGGKNVAPSELERLLVRDPLIDQAVVCGDCRPYVAALIVPNFEALAAALAPAPLKTAGDLIEDEAARALVAQRVDLVMRPVSLPERVRAFLLLSRPFQVEEAELTATMKVRRAHVLTKYRDRLDALYRDGQPTAGRGLPLSE